MNSFSCGGTTPTFKPSAFYFRRGLRAARTVDEAIAVGLVAVRELEHLKAWARSLGLEPPKMYVMADEALEKGWACESTPPSPADPETFREASV